MKLLEALDCVFFFALFTLYDLLTWAIDVRSVILPVIFPGYRVAAATRQDETASHRTITAHDISKGFINMRDCMVAVTNLTQLGNLNLQSVYAKKFSLSQKSRRERLFQSNPRVLLRLQATSRMESFVLSPYDYRTLSLR